MFHNLKNMNVNYLHAQKYSNYAHIPMNYKSNLELSVIDFIATGERFGMTVAMKARTEISPNKWESSLINLND